jgi:presenilin-like A22 family membrane protease
MNRRRRALAAAGFTAVLFLLVQVGALALVRPFEAAGMQAFSDPQDPTNSLLYVALVLVATGGMLLAFRFGGDGVVRALVVLTAGLLSWYVLVVVFPLRPAVAGAAVFPAAGALAVIVALAVYPEWWVIDASGVLMGAGAAGLFGISFGVGPALILLTVLAVYDALSVYGTEHMLSLAEGVLALRVPVLFVVPTTLSYSFLDDAEAADGDEANAGHGDGTDADSDGGEQATEVDTAETVDEGESPGADDGESGPIDETALERDALFVGLGDAVIPTVLVASAAVFVDAPSLVGGLALNAPALGAMVGTMVGLGGLLTMVFRGEPHAGLPLLNGGAIAGYLVAALATGVPLAAALGL